MNQSLSAAMFVLVRLLLSSILCAAMGVSVLARNPQQSGTDESWTATTDTSLANGNPARTTESHTKSANRTVDKKKIEVLGINGHYEPFSESETETVQIDATTIRMVVRNFNWDGNGRRKLAQLTEEESRTTGRGDTRTERKTSISDLNGNLQVAEREIVSTRKISSNVEETKSAVYRPDSYGGFSQVLETNELKTHNADGSVAVTSTNRIPDGNGGWKVSDQTKTTIMDDGNNRITDERFSHSDLDGGLHETSRVLTKEENTGTGDRKRTVETYSIYAPGYFDSRVHLQRRVTTVQRKDRDGETGEEEIEQPSAGNPSDGPRVVARTKYLVQQAGTGTESKKTFEARDVNGRFNVTSVETRKSTEAPPVPNSGGVHLEQRVTTVQRKDPDGGTSEERIEQPGGINPSGGPRATSRTKYVVQYARTGTESKQTVEVHDDNITRVGPRIEEPSAVNSSGRPKVSAKRYVVQYAGTGTESKKTAEAHDANSRFSASSAETQKSTQAPAVQNSQEKTSPR
jgi:hypothetical protein